MSHTPEKHIIKFRHAKHHIPVFYMAKPKLLDSLLQSSKITNVNIFKETINPSCSCSLEIEPTSYYFLCCQNFTDHLKCLTKELLKIDSCILTTVWTKNLPQNSLDRRYGNETHKYNINSFQIQLFWLKFWRTINVI